MSLEPTTWHYVYLLRSLTHPTRTYVGETSKLPEIRLSEHNAGDSAYTSRHRPWKLESFIAVASRQQALQLEKYLKQGSGHRLAQRYFFMSQ